MNKKSLLDLDRRFLEAKKELNDALEKSITLSDELVNAFYGNDFTIEDFENLKSINNGAIVFLNSDMRYKTLDYNVCIEISNLRLWSESSN